MNRKRQGDIGVAAALMYYTEQGYSCLIPFTDDLRYDLAVDKDGVLYKIQCKTSGMMTDSGSYRVQLATQGGNKSGTGEVKKIDSSECDLVFIRCTNGDMYEIPVSLLHGSAAICTGKKWHPYRVGW